MTRRLKEMILKRAEEKKMGMDIDGDIIKIFDKLYMVSCINYEVKEIK